MRYQARYTHSPNGSRMQSGGISDWTEDRDASEKRGCNTAPIQEEELRYYDPKIDPDDRPSLDARVLLMTFIDEGDVGNVKRMLSFTTTCTPDFLNRVDGAGGYHHRLERATFLTAALASDKMKPLQALEMATVLADAGCAAWNGCFYLAGESGYSAFHMLFLPFLKPVGKTRLRALIQKALDAGADPHRRAHPLAKTPYEVAQKNYPQLLGMLSAPPPDTGPKTMKIETGFFRSR